MALLVSGGRFSEASVPRIARFIEEALIFEADVGGTATAPARRSSCGH